MGATAPLTSCGGGAGAYRHVSGDFPFAALRSAKTQGPTVTSVSYGGGAGAYKHVSGDFPIAALCGAKKQFNLSASFEEEHRFRSHSIQRALFDQFRRTNAASST